MNPTECQCENAGPCSLLRRHEDPPEGRTMHPVRHGECRTKPHYYAMFLSESIAGGAAPKTQAGIPETDWSEPTRCQHLGDVLDTERQCNLCGLRGTPFTVRQCAVHCECSERPRHSRMANCLGCEEYLKSSEHPPLEWRVDRPIKTWAVGITTAPRSQHYTLDECLRSVIANGWQPTIYAEPGSRLPVPRAGLEIVQRPKRLGVWHNWLSMARELIQRHPDADAVLTIQDDTVFHPQARWFAEHHFNVREPRVWSLYTPRHYGQRKGENRPVGVHRIFTKALWGACALVFLRSLLEQIVNSPIAENWLGVPPRRAKRSEWMRRQVSDPSRIQNSDTAIGKILANLGIDYYCPVPSLADHIALASADGVGHGGRGGRRSAAWFAEGDLREIFRSV